MVQAATPAARQPVASVVVPVYNKEAFLAECLACLEAQTLAKDELEVVLVDDGSTDGSLAKCEELAASHPWVRVLSQSNGGVCEARNAGIRAARGRFIFFLDPDDTVSPETLANVSAFFETCPDDVDMVTYPIVSIRDGKRQRLHCRYAVLDETGVYDLNDPACAIVAQTTMNVAVRNCFGDNVLFDWRPEAGAVIHEDEKYCTDVLQRTMKLGFCAEAEYRWMRHDEGVTTASAQPEHLYDNNLALYEELFGRYEGAVPPYVQGLLVNDIAWKMNSRIALPTHVGGTAYDEALARMGRLLERVDDRLIMTHPTLKREYRLFVLGLKKTVPLVWHAAPGALAVTRGDEVVFAAGEADAVLQRIAVRDGRLFVEGRVESPFLAGWQGSVELVLCRRYHRCDRAVREEVLELTESAAGYYDDAVKVNDFYDFSFTCELGESEDVWLDLRIDGCSIPLRWSVKDLARSAYALRNTRIVGDWRVCADLERSKFVVDHLTGKKREAALKLLDGRVPRWKTRLNRRLVRRRASRETVWLYTDGPEGPGAAWQAFQQDAQRNDGISRYYAARPDARSAAMSPLVDGASAVEAPKADKKVGQSGTVIAFGSRRHKTLFCAAQKLLISDEAYDSYAPMPEKSLLDFADLFNAEINLIAGR